MTRFVLKLGLLTAMACAGLNAQTMALRANIPFDFHVGDKLMPAGEYTILNERDTLTLRSEVGRKSSLALSQRAVRTDMLAKGELVFNRYESDYFLSQLWAPAEYAGRSLPKVRLERERAKQLAQRNGAVQSARVAAHP